MARTTRPIVAQGRLWAFVGAVPVLALTSANCSSGEREDAAQSELASGTYKVVTRVSGKCLDVNGSGTADGTNIQEWTCNGTGAQSFRAEDAGGGSYRFVNTSSGKCVDVNGAGSADGTNIQLWNCNGTAAQTFRVESVGSGYSRLVNTASNKCVDVNGGASGDGTNVQLWTCNGGKAQAWKLTLLSGAPDAGAACSAAECASGPTVGTCGAGTHVSGTVCARRSDGVCVNTNQCANDPPDAGNGGNGPPQVETFDTYCLSVPDPDVAAGPDLFGMVGQWNAYFYKKDGTFHHKFTWQALRGNLISDTHIVFDPSSQRWFLTTIVDLGNNEFGVQVMVSLDATASSWQTSIPATMTGLIDNPQPTVTSDKVVLVFHGNCLWAVDKQTLYSGNAPVVQPSTCALAPSDNIVAVKYGGIPPSTGYAVTLNDDRTLNWISVDGTQAGGNIQVHQHPILVPNIDEVPVFGGVTQNGMDIESGEVKAMWQAGHLVWAKSVKCATGSCERVFDIDTVSNTVMSHDFSLAGTQLWFGVPGLDKSSNTWVLMAEATPSGNVGLALAGIYASGKIYDPNVIVQGQSALTGGNRFGDYFSASQDPVDGSSWLIGQYAAAPGNPLNTEGGSAGCKVVHVTTN
jgi:hypothetical protein